MSTSRRHVKNTPRAAEIERSKYLPQEIFYDITVRRKLSFYTNTLGFYRMVKNDHIHFRYQPIRKLGRGGYGEVIEAIDHKTNDEVVVKILRRNRGDIEIFYNKYLLYYYKQEPIESVVRFLDNFTFRGHKCLVFEKLYCDLTEIRNINPGGLVLDLVKEIMQSTLLGLRQIHNAGVIHNDIKTANIMIVEPKTTSTKIIDLGLARIGRQEYDGPTQTIYYRSPEVILQLPYGPESDMWSIACVAVELFTGNVLFQGRDDSEQLGRIMEVLGFPPRKLIKRSPVCKKYFITEDHPLYKTQTSLKYSYKLTPTYCKTLGQRQPQSNHLNLILNCVDTDFYDFLTRCLAWQPEDRLDVTGALKHPWITGQALAAQKPVRHVQVKRRLNLPKSITF